MNLGKLKVVQMRKELEARGLETSGTRPLLMKRLREALARESSGAPVRDLTHTPLPARAPAAEGAGASPRAASPAREPREPAPEDAPRGTDHAPEPPAERAPERERDERERRPDERERVRDEGELGQQRAREEEKDGEPGRPPRSHAADETRVGESADHGEPAPGPDSGKKLHSEASESAKAEGNVAEASKKSLDERLRKRRERFGTVERPPAVRKRTVDQGTKRPPAGEELRHLEEAKRRRLAKFGPVEGKPSPAVQPDVSAEERERRLKRQRRFQRAGSATAV